MKKLLLIPILFLTLSSFAQERGSQDRIKALKIAFITEQLQLTETEAQQFWPIYNNFEIESSELRAENFNRFRDFDSVNLTEEEAKVHLQTMLENDEKKHQLKKQFATDLMKVLPAKKIILLKVSEEAFKKRMMDRLKNHREGFRRNRP